MKNQKQKNKLRIKVMIFIGFLFIQSCLISSFFPQNSGNISEIPLEFKDMKLDRISPNWESHDPIYIDGNAALDAFCSGNGTDGSKNNPHIIKNFSIDSSNLVDSFVIKNIDRYLEIDNCNFYNYGGDDFSSLYIENCKNIEVSNTRLLSNRNGLKIWSSSDIIVWACNIQNNFQGIDISWSNFTTLYGNEVRNNYAGIKLSYSHNNSVRWNYVRYNNKAYWVGQGIEIVRSNGNLFERNEVTHNSGEGFLLSYSNYNEFIENIVSENHHDWSVNCLGFRVVGSHYNKFYKNTVFYNDRRGFEFQNSYNCTIENNEITGNFIGIDLDNCYNITIIYNSVLENYGNGIYLENSFDIDIFNNIIMKSMNYGIELSSSFDIQVTNNTSSQNRYRGLYLRYSNSCIIENNEICSNQYGIYFIHSNDSTLYHNWCQFNTIENFYFTESYNNIFINSPPEILEFQIIPNDPLRNEDLFVSYEFQDCEDDPEGDTEIRWYKNNVLQPVYNDQKNISGSITEAGDIWNVSVKPHDGTLYGIQKNYSVEIIDNERPIATEAIINNNLTRVSFFSNLTLSYEYFDIDGDIEVDTIIFWYKNSIIQPEYNNSLTVNHSAIDGGDTWRASIQVFDGISYGDIIWSNEIEINALPSINAYLWPSNPTTFHLIGLQFYYSDEDGDTVITENIKWFRDGILVPELNDSQNSISDLYTECFQQWYVEFNYSDGYDNFTYITDNITVKNSKPTIWQIEIWPSQPTKDKNLNVDYEYFDGDDHPETGTEILWYLNNVLMEQYNNTKTIPKSVLVDGDEWRVTVCPFDGYDYGDLYEITVTVGEEPIEEEPPISEEESSKIDGYSTSFTIFFMVISVIGLITNRKKKIE